MEFLGIDEFLDTHPRHMPDIGRTASSSAAESALKVSAAPAPAMGLTISGKPRRSAAAHARDCLGGLVLRRAEARAIDELLHLLLVAKRHRLRHRQPGHVKLLTQPRGEHHVGLPEAFDPVDAHLASQLAHGRRDRFPGGQGTDRDVVRERLPRDGRDGGPAGRPRTSTPMTDAPAAARPRVKNAISPG